MRNYKTPGVYVEEISTLPPSVVPVSTAIPAFIGYTEKGTVEVRRIASLTEYRAFFGGPFPEAFANIEVTVTKSPANEDIYTVTKMPTAPTKPTYWLYYQLQMYFANGGGPCYIVSVGKYKNSGTRVEVTPLSEGLKALRKEDEPTLIVSPDLIGLSASDKYYSYHRDALLQCAELKDRFTIIDLFGSSQDLAQDVKDFRGEKGIGTNNLNYAAAYHPWLETTLGYGNDESLVSVTVVGGAPNVTGHMLRFDTSTSGLAALAEPPGNPAPDKKDFYEKRSLYHLDNGAYTKIKAAIESFRLTLPPSGAMAGIYAQVDNSRGVFKAPANVSVNGVVRPLVKISNEDQADLNVHTSGKSINCIRSFSDKGILVWGARTLDGNSNEWRYVPVRRLFIFAEESISKALERFVFEPNNENTWVSVKAAIENFLTDQWKAGALAGSTPQQAFFVNVGLGQTMTAQDILEGRLVVMVGMAAVRPAEFIVLQFTHKLQEA